MNCLSVLDHFVRLVLKGLILQLLEELVYLSQELVILSHCVLKLNIQVNGNVC